MNTEQPRRVDFEERLLHELRGLLVAEPSSKREPPRRKTRTSVALRPRRRLALAGGLAVLLVVAAGTGMPLLTGGAAPAYAVSTNDDGTVTVEINSLTDAAGLESELREAGIRAVVEYLPPGKTCKQPWYTPVSQDHGPGHERATTREVEHTSDGDTRFTIGKHHPTDATLVIMAQSGAEPGATSIAVDYAQGRVDACVIVDAPSGGQPSGLSPPGGQLHTEAGTAGPHSSTSAG